jgi:phosphate transport system protein
MPMHLHHDLEDLHTDLLRLAGAAEAAVQKAIAALRQRNRSLAQEVVADDDAIDAEEIRLDRECLKIIALYQPVAGDLRQVAAAMRIGTDLERIADLAEEIARQALHLAEHSWAEVPAGLQGMADLAATMVRQSLGAFVRKDLKLARRVCRKDGDVKRLHAEVNTELAAVMKRSPELVEPALALFAAARHLERIADHAANIAEDVIYLAEGEIVRHRPECLQEQGAEA